MSWRTLFCLLIVVGLLSWFWARGERFITANGLTFDEGVHLSAGYAYWSRGDFSINCEDPPLMKLLWALPAVLGHSLELPQDLTTDHWLLAERVLFSGGQYPQALIASARRINLAVGCGVLIVAGWWTTRMSGSRAAGVVAVAFAASDPTLLALSCILSTDVGLTFFALSTCYLAWEYVRAPSRGLLYGLGISLGLLLATKFSAVAVLAGLGLLGAIATRRGQLLALPGYRGVPGLRSTLELAVRLAVIATCTLALTYGIIHFEQWGLGLKFQLTRGGHGDGVMYLNGEISRHGWYHYFLEALALKLPLGLSIAAGFGGLLLVRDKRRHEAIWLMVPPLVFLALASYSRINHGVRVVLPVVPFLYLLAARLADGCCCRAVRLLCLVPCLLWTMGIAEHLSPHELTYHNELASLIERSSPPLADSNLDWGQGLPALKSWMDAAGINWVALAYFGTDLPELHGICCWELPGYGRVPAIQQCSSRTCRASRPGNAPVIVAVSTNHLLGLYLNDVTLYSWLRNRPPVAVLDGSIHVFDVTGDAEAIAHLQSFLKE